MVISSWSRRRRPAFTLIEVLVVVCITAILMALAAPAVNTVVLELRIAQAMRTVVDEINFCRETAAGRNTVSQLCLIQCPPPDDPRGASVFCGVTSRLLQNDGTTVWLRNITWFPTGIVLAAGSSYSNILSGVPSLPAAGLALNSIPSQSSSGYVGINVRPSGALEPAGTLGPTDTWFLTVLSQQNLQTAPSAIKNCAVVQIDPLTTRTTVYRPQ